MLFSLFDRTKLEGEQFFKYTKGEKWEKKDLLNMIDNEIDFSQPLKSSLKDSYNMRQMFCIEVATSTDKGYQSILYEQLINIKSKYQNYGGGIKIDIHEAFIHPADGFLFKCFNFMMSLFCLNNIQGVRNYIKGNFGTYKFFYLVSLSEDLLTKLASDMRLETYDMKEDFHTTYNVLDVN